MQRAPRAPRRRVGETRRQAGEAGEGLDDATRRVRGEHQRRTRRPGCAAAAALQGILESRGAGASVDAGRRGQRGQHDDPAAWTTGQVIVASPRSVEPGHADVHEHDVRARLRASATAWSPSAASPTTWRPASADRIIRKPVRMSRSSSSSRTRWSPERPATAAAGREPRSLHRHLARRPRCRRTDRALTHAGDAATLGCRRGE